MKTKTPPTRPSPRPEIQVNRSMLPSGFRAHPIRGPLNAAFFSVMQARLDRYLRPQKSRVFADLPPVVVELGAGVGANLRYLPPGARLIAIEPNPSMHPWLRRAARGAGVELEIRDVVAERIDLPEASVDTVISSLVLCSVADPAAVLAEVRRILVPGGRFSFAEHVVAPQGSRTRTVQRVLRRPWSWAFEGCSCERDLAAIIRAAGFRTVEITPYRLGTPLIPFNPQIAGTATT